MRLYLGLLLAACSSEPTTEPADASIDASAMDATHDSGSDGDASIAFPQKLSETGLYTDFKSRTIDPRYLTFVPRYELWSDGAGKSRWMYLPEGTQIDTTDPD